MIASPLERDPGDKSVTISDPRDPGFWPTIPNPFDELDRIEHTW